ncbi:hypothetical protein M9458_009009, partial [Cirrhinus mrigala]
MGKKEMGTSEHLNTVIIIPPHGRLLDTKRKIKSRPGPLSSSTLVTLSFRSSSVGLET